MRYTSEQQRHEDAIVAAYKAVENAIGPEALEIASARLVGLIRSRDTDVTLFLENQRMERVQGIRLRAACVR